MSQDEILSEGTERSLEALLAPYLNKTSTAPARLSENDVRQISTGLQRLGKDSWAKVPRLYTVLRMINQVQVIDSFLDQGVSDIWFPFSQKTLPESLRSASARNDFLELQDIVLTKAFDIEREDGKHRHFSRPEDIPLQKLEELGKGGFGYVDRVLSTITYKEYARKLIPRGRTFRKDLQILKDFERELNNLKKMSHIHVVELVGSYTDPKFVGILMSPVADFNLKAFLEQASLSSGERSFLRTFFGCLASALCYLHGNQIRHKDIKPQNVLVKGHQVYLTDFGISLDWSDLGQSTTTGYTVKTPRYCAPEVANYLPRNTLSDVWSLGCVFVEIWTVLKRESTNAIFTYLECQRTKSTCYYLNFESVLDWCNILESKTTNISENPPLTWIRGMLQIDQEQRWTAQTLVDRIQQVNDNEDLSFAFSGLCCVGDGDSTVTGSSSKRSSMLLGETGASSIGVYVSQLNANTADKDEVQHSSLTTSLTLRPLNTLGASSELLQRNSQEGANQPLEVLKHAAIPAELLPDDEIESEEPMINRSSNATGESEIQRSIKREPLSRHIPPDAVDERTVADRNTNDRLFRFQTAIAMLSTLPGIGNSNFSLAPSTTSENAKNPVIPANPLHMNTRHALKIEGKPASESEYAPDPIQPVTSLAENSQPTGHWHAVQPPASSLQVLTKRGFLDKLNPKLPDSPDKGATLGQSSTTDAFRSPQPILSIGSSVSQQLQDFTRSATELELSNKQDSEPIKPQDLAKPTTNSSFGMLEALPLLAVKFSNPVKSQVDIDNHEHQRAQNENPDTKVYAKCASCRKKLTDRCVRALNVTYHFHCFTCRDCGKNVSHKFYPTTEKDGSGLFPLCKHDYFSRLGLICFKCGGALHGSYIAALGHKYHLDHFTCSICPFTFGEFDSYYATNETVYCEYHYITCFAPRCKSCKTPILKQLVEKNKKGKKVDKEDNVVWHPECHEILDIYKINLEIYDPIWSRINVGRPGGDLSISDDARKTISNAIEETERLIYHIWSSLSKIHKRLGACAANVQSHLDNMACVDGLVALKDFLLEIEVLFGAADSVASLRIKHGLGWSHPPEAGRCVEIFCNIICRVQDTRKAKLKGTTELFTALLMQLDQLTGKALQGALQIRRIIGTEDGLDTLVNELNGSHDLTKREGFQSLDLLFTHDLKDGNLDCCFLCRERITGDSIIMFGKKMAC